MKNYILLAALAALFASCQLQDPSKQKNEANSDVPHGVVKEVMQTNNYTYLLVEVNGNDTWVAGPKTAANTGDDFYFIENMKMQDFTSKELNKHFDNIIFALKMSKDPKELKKTTNPMDATNHQANVKIKKKDIQITAAVGITSIAELFSNKDKFSGNMLKIKGVVTKYNAGIMGKNWIHIQDGTEKDGKYDLVATSSIQCKVGDTLTLEGKLSLDKDFGYGYKYELLLEDAVSK